jgi:PAS domain S-box-containing protein
MIMDLARFPEEMPLASEDEGFRLIFEQSPVGIAVIDVSMRVMRANPAFFELLGYSEEEITGCRIPLLVHADDRIKGKHFQSQFLKGEISSFKDEIRYLRKDGSAVWAKITAAPLLGHSSKCCILFSENIMSEKLAEEKRMAHAGVQRNTLIREVNHRIKNNIQSVIGLLRYQMRQNPELSASMQQAIERLHAVAIVHGIQGISRLGNCSLVTLVSQICDAVEVTGYCRPKLQILLSKDVIVVEEESVPTALIVNELVANAIKHGNIRKSPIRVTLDGDRRRASIRIDNAASGRDVFKMESGTGLGTGLNLVHALLPPIGSSLSVKPGHGEVTVELTLTQPIIR